jgi:hypothetical protein
VLKVKGIILLILIVLAFFGVLYIIDWVRETFNLASSVYVDNPVTVASISNNPSISL